MTVTNLGLLGSGSATTAGTTITVTNTSGAAIPAGTLLHIVGCWDNTATVTAPTVTCSTVGGATATANHATAVGSGVTTTAGSGIWHQCWRVLTTASIAAGATIATLTSNQSAVKRAASARGWGAATATLRGTVATGASTTGAPSVATAGTALVAGDLVIGSVSFENNAQMTSDADTLNGSWAAIVGTFTTGGAADTNVGTGSQAKIVTATGAQTFNPTGGGADTVACVYSVRPAPIPTGSSSGAVAWVGSARGHTPDVVGFTPAIELWVDGVRFPDGCTDAPPDAPYALTGLAVTWGREDVLDQPSPATATFEVVDEVGGQQYLDAIHVGSLVRILANALLWAPADFPTIPVPAPVQTLGGESGAVGSTVVLWPSPGSQYVHGDVRPAPPSSDPDAWFDVPRSVAGQTWQLNITAVFVETAFLGWVRPAGTVAAHPLLWESPDDTVPTVMPPIPLTGTFVPPSGYWVGVRVVWTPTGPRWNQLTNPAAWSSLGATPSWEDLAELHLFTLQVLAPQGGTVRTALVFEGRVTDLEARFDDTLGAAVCQVTAQDLLAELNNRLIGDQPWAAEPIGQRLPYMVGLAGFGTTNTVLDATVAATNISRRDVDAQPAGRLMQELATTGDGVLWTASHLGGAPDIRVDSMSERPSAYVLTPTGPGGSIIVDLRGSFTGAAVELSACAVDLDPVRWRQDSTDVATRVSVGWLAQEFDNDGQPVQKEHREQVTDPGVEARIGSYSVSMSTQLRDVIDARLLATTWLARLSEQGWRIGGLVWSATEDETLDAVKLDQFVTLLDVMQRNGCPIMLVDLPYWSPVTAGEDRVPLFLEGGKYESVDGGWVLRLVTTSAQALGRSATWQEIPAPWRWQDSIRPCGGST